MPAVDPSFRYAWLIWASVLLLPWAALFVAWPALRGRMLWASALTAPFGLTEPLFVPAYWNPPTLFDLAQRTGFDIESVVFCFGLGGLTAAGYRALAPVASERALVPDARDSRRHRWHLAALASPFLVFGALLLFRWNPIDPAIAALFTGALASGMCRPDLWRNALVGGVVLFTLYAVFLLGLDSLWPGYIEAVWNLDALIAWRPAGLPLEELLLGFGFGMYWSSVYEHVTWRPVRAAPPPPLTVCTAPRRDDRSAAKGAS